MTTVCKRLVKIAAVAVLSLLADSSFGAPKHQRHPDPPTTHTEQTSADHNNTSVFDYGTFPVPFGTQAPVPQIVQFITENHSQDRSEHEAAWADLLKPRPDNLLNWITLALALSTFLLWWATKRSVQSKNVLSRNWRLLSLQSK